MDTLERAREMLEKVKNGYDPELAVYIFHDNADVKRVDMDAYAWMLSHPQYWTPKGEAIQFFEELIERLQKEGA